MFKCIVKNYRPERILLQNEDRQTIIAKTFDLNRPLLLLYDFFRNKFWGLLTSSKIILSKAIKLIENFRSHHFVKINFDKSQNMIIRNWSFWKTTYYIFTYGTQNPKAYRGSQKSKGMKKCTEGDLGSVRWLRTDWGVVGC